MTRVHLLLYRLTGGGVGGLALGVPVLLLTTRGRKSGRLSTTPDPPGRCAPHSARRVPHWLAEGEAFAVVASYGGSPRHPDWWLNLQAHEGTIQVGPHRFRVRAEEASAAVRERLMPAFTRLYPAYADYQARTERVIPVVLLHPL